MIGMGTIITKKSNIKPGGVYVGNPARFIKDNTFGLEKNNVSLEYLEELNQRYDELIITR
jgi:acetyltransferase-like isoleucine patch superfamily enzyme